MIRTVLILRLQRMRNHSRFIQHLMETVSIIKVAGAGMEQTKKLGIDTKTRLLKLIIKYIKKKSLFPKAILCYDFLEVPERFNCIRQVLLNDFTPKYPPLESNKGLYKVINKYNSVCISIRRGDYLNHQYADKFYICDENYIQRAIDMIKQLVDHPVLVFFSDDIKWVKDTIITDIQSYYESGDDPVWEKLRLMYSCKHFVISNSTFSWWAQYLSRNEDKIVISPDRWFNDDSINVHHLISDDFITIPCGKNSRQKQTTI